MSTGNRALRVTALGSSAQLGGTERVLLDFAARAFEHDIALRVLTPTGGPLIEILNEIGVPADVLPAGGAALRGSQRAGHLWSVPGSVIGLMGWARRMARHEYFRDADALYTLGFKTHFAVAALRRHPVVWHLHEYPPGPTAAVWRMMGRSIPDAMIANSVATAEAWRGGAGKGERGTGSGERSPGITVIPNGVDLDRFHPRPRSYWIHQRLGLSHDQRLIGMPAVFARWKGQLEVIEAFASIRTQFPDVHLVIVGGSIYDTVAETEYEEELRGVMESSGATGHGKWEEGKGNSTDEDHPTFPISHFPQLHLLPFQSKVELLYPELDLTLHYSLRPEPFGRVVLESMASGVPVIAAGEGGPVEIIGETEKGKGETDQEEPVTQAAPGWLAPPRDIPQLARVLREALSLPPQQLDTMGQAARRRAEDHFSARQFARRVADVLRGVVLGI